MRNALRDARAECAALQAEKASDAWHQGWQVAVRERDDARREVAALRVQVDKLTILTCDASSCSGKDECTHALDPWRVLFERDDARAALALVIAERDALKDTIITIATADPEDVLRHPAEVIGMAKRLIA